MVKMILYSLTKVIQSILIVIIIEAIQQSPNIFLWGENYNK